MTTVVLFEASLVRSLRSRLHEQDRNRDLSDEELHARDTEESRGELAARMLDYIPRALRKSFRGKLDEEDLEDITQNTLIKSHVGRYTYDSSKGRYRTWVFQIARREAINHMKKEKRFSTATQLKRAIQHAEKLGMHRTAAELQSELNRRQIESSDFRLGSRCLAWERIFDTILRG